MCWYIFFCSLTSVLPINTCWSIALLIYHYKVSFPAVVSQTGCITLYPTAKLCLLGRRHCPVSQSVYLSVCHIYVSLAVTYYLIKRSYKLTWSFQTQIWNKKKPYSILRQRRNRTDRPCFDFFLLGIKFHKLQLTSCLEKLCGGICLQWTALVLDKLEYVMYYVVIYTLPLTLAAWVYSKYGG